MSIKNLIYTKTNHSTVKKSEKRDKIMTFQLRLILTYIIIILIINE